MDPPGTGTEQSRNFLSPRQERHHPPGGSAATAAQLGEEQKSAVLATQLVNPDRIRSIKADSSGDKQEER